MIKMEKEQLKDMETLIIGKPVFSDVFWLLERKFFDRFGWEQLVIEKYY